MSGKDIAKAFKSASRKACDRAIANGRSVVVKRGRRIVELKPNGKQRTVRTLEKAYVRASANAYKVK